jgi:hypothetical protein
MDTDDIEEQYIPEGGIRIGKNLINMANLWCLPGIRIDSVKICGGTNCLLPSGYSEKKFQYVILPVPGTVLLKK